MSLRRSAFIPPIAIVFFFLVAGSPAIAGAPTEAIRETSDKIVHLLQDREMLKPERTQDRRARLEEVIGQRMNYMEVAKRTLGQQWEVLNEQDRREFIRLFRTLLAKTYADKIERYGGNQMRYVHERLEGQFAEVRTKMAASKTEFELIFRLMNQAGKWWVYDIVADGVGFVNNYRQQFQRILHKSSYQKLLEALRAKAAAGPDSSRG